MERSSTITFPGTKKKVKDFLTFLGVFVLFVTLVGGTWITLESRETNAGSPKTAISSDPAAKTLLLEGSGDDFDGIKADLDATDMSVLDDIDRM